ncbi:hypothetical protein LAUMK4_03090 [Mycobacterium persicum]|uniref:Uncharacterized protein n=1 Tax=Mycobacterium persicum TaxID=1487726 RepID=A0AB38UUG8_9MYCO|nr:hypothetical protein LAUMK42_03143 [Mycobacterium persicum]VAZ95297.1 hypothetical protein LAUMK4_03090 [Mycobacterium persicum]
MAARAASNAAAANRAWAAACSACSAAAFNQPTWVAAASAIVAAAGPCHDEPARPKVSDENANADEPSSAANRCHAAAVASIGAEPAPANIRAELCSGGNPAKSITSP